MQVLQTLPWPPLSVGEDLTKMYFRSTKPVTWSPIFGLYDLGPSDVIDLSTYFGAFSLTSWCSLSGIDEVVLRIKISGSAKIRIVHFKPAETQEVLAEKVITNNPSSDGNWTEIVLGNLSGKEGILYPVITVLEERTNIEALEYATTQTPCSEVRMAIIMPTFKREVFVQRNIEKISKILPDYKGSISLIVIDNGKTLNIDPLPPEVTLIPNGNFGGSGGFSRGLLEALDDPRHFTHFLFCDDDIEMEIETIRRTFAIWQYLGDESVLGGAMLSLSKKDSIVAVGGFYNSETCSLVLPPPMSSSLLPNLIDHDLPRSTNYFGWWYFSFSRSVYDLIGMPLPIFVRGDDVEYGIRISKRPIKYVTLLGCGVWHEDFMKKKITLVMDFYSTRNMKIINILYGQRSLRTLLFKALEYVFNNLLLYRYTQARIYLYSWADFLKGPEHIMEQFRSAPDFHLQLMKDYQLESVEGFKKQPVENPDSPLPTPFYLKILILLTINGHLLPGFLFRGGASQRVEDYGSFKLKNIFRFKNVIYYDENTDKGYIHRHDKGAFFSIVFEAVRLSIRTLMVFTSLKKRYQDAFPQMTSEEYWREVFHKQGKK